ncbi:PREDICTED: uncharacterized protein LOC104602755 [Nelumbo nucifera]|uniref:Uncharacterized protein LOC104602755 n=2 Tax=Nelumbo nucifera TaxID=4432 RepID=A0A1U8ABN3_NELNU|nr:PREDICTED: uncharacterized protein LOC104602755 [Nelumbo nucifera]DAD34705.1 TPA_asm: hypothetical protein HUJ06_005345 [Nelumbo nucifera]
MGLFTYCLAGGGLMLIGAWEALISSYAHLNPSSPLSQPHTPSTTAGTTTTTRVRKNPSSSSVSFIAVSVFSFFFIFNSLVSLIDALHANDGVGFALQLEIIALVSLFLLYSAVGLLVDFTGSIPLPSSILNFIALIGFGQEFLLFYLQRKDPSGIENRYFDLLLLPIAICIFSTVLEFVSSKSNFPRLARGVGLILQGTWFVQMGFSFYTSLIAHGCSLHEKSRGNYTMKCKGHPEYHRGRAIATLQFNCHLAFLVVLIVGVYSVIGHKYGISRGDFTNYKLLSAELQKLDSHSRFTLDSDDDDVDEIKEENVGHQKSAVSVSKQGVNGFAAH